jgi:hypothetical protein
MRKRTGISAANRRGIETERAVKVLAQPCNPPRVVNKNIRVTNVTEAVTEAVKMVDLAQQNLMSLQCVDMIDRGRRRLPHAL